MTAVAIEDHGDVALVRLRNGATNAIGPAMLTDLDAVISQVEGEYRGMVLAGGEKFFSIGFDLPSLLQLDREEFTGFWGRFNQAFIDIYTLAVPTACAITGHAVAGGAVLSLSTDFRIGAKGRKQIGLNEIKLGIPVPYSTDLVLRQLTGDRAATDLIYGGEFITATDAADIGLVDEITEPEQVETRALEKIQALASFPQSAFRMIKRNRTELVRQQYDNLKLKKDKYFIDTWFTDPVQKLLAEAAKSF